MKKSSKSKSLCGLFLLLVDQVTKVSSVYLNMAEFNAGIAFGIGKNHIGKSEFAGWILIVVILILLWDFSRRRVNWADIMILAGGVSNLIDRWYWKSVVDWIHVGTLWFNLGDIYIMVGVIWIFLSYFRTQSSLSSTNRPD